MLLQTLLAPPNPDSIEALMFGAMLSISPAKAYLAHKHEKAQLVYAHKQNISVCVESTIWSIPVNHALVIPSGKMHYLNKIEEVELYALFIDVEKVDFDLSDSFIFSMPPLINQLIIRFIKEPPFLQGSTTRGQHLSLVLLDELSDIINRKTALPLPVDRRLLRLTSLFMQRPEQRLSLDEWGQKIGTSRRTLTRIFLQQTGISFGRWCREYHVKMAIDMMAEGHSVSVIANALGYSHSSSFISMFKSITGKSPVEYKNSQR